MDPRLIPLHGGVVVDVTAHLSPGVLADDELGVTLAEVKTEYAPPETDDIHLAEGGR